MEKKLYRSRSDRMIFGVCGGLAAYFGIDPTIVRLIAILLLFAGGTGVLAYVVLAIFIPLESSPAKEPRDVIKENVEEIKQTATQFGDEMRSTFGKQGSEKSEAKTSADQNRYIFAVVLIALGVFFLLSNIFSWFGWHFWPVILILVGLMIIFGGRK